MSKKSLDIIYQYAYLEASINPILIGSYPQEITHAINEETPHRRRALHAPVDAHGDGEFDSAGRWYPAEEGDCCAQIRRPSRAYPYALLTHCRSIQHVAAAHGYTPQQLRWAIKRLKTEEA